jgi:hypothetical protein
MQQVEHAVRERDPSSCGPMDLGKASRLVARENRHV